MSLDTFFSRSLKNVDRHGDTDIFPFPIESLVFRDKKQDIIDLLKNMAGDFKSAISHHPPSNVSALAPVNYTGFRWATQLDPIWNAFFLGIILSIADKVEQSRIPNSDNVVFSYRYKWDPELADIFDPNFSWRKFMEQSLINAEKCKFVVVCDISEFYARINHHKIENALMQIDAEGSAKSMIMGFLSYLSSTYSFGLPVGGPAARILSELLLDQIDRLLVANSVKFCRYSDDYHIFADSYEEAFKALVFLNETLLRNQGLQLQKSKTRIISSAEFMVTSPIPSPRSSREIFSGASELIRFSFKFDPYAFNAKENYDILREQMSRIDILGMLKSELGKSRVHISLARKIVAAIRYIDKLQWDDAVISLVNNSELLYPIFANVLIVCRTLFDDLQPATQDLIIDKVSSLIREQSHVFSVDVNLAYAVRLLSCKQRSTSIQLLNDIFKQSRSVLLRRDVILIMAKWRQFYWLSDLRIAFRTLDPLERRAFIVASFTMTDEGKHWRDAVESEFSRLEIVIRDWAASKKSISGWEVPV